MNTKDQTMTVRPMPEATYPPLLTPTCRDRGVSPTALVAAGWTPMQTELKCYNELVSPEGVRLKRTLGKDYWISESGELWSGLTHTMMKARADKDGYAVVAIRTGRGTAYRRVHRLIAIAWIPNPLGYPMVLHRDDNKMNNSISNLYWGTQQDNMADSKSNGTFPIGSKNGMARLTDSQVYEMKEIRHRIGATISELTFMFDTPGQTVWSIVSGKTRGHVYPIQMPVCSRNNGHRMTEEEIEYTMSMRGKDTAASVAREIGVSRSTVLYHWKKKINRL